jgi:flagellar FliJ protein
MAKFVYRMQNILEIKEKLESQAKVEFGLKNRAYMEQQQILQEYVVRRVGYEKHLKETMQGDLDLSEVSHARADLTNMKTIVRRQMMEVHKAEKELEDARAKLNEVRKERKIQEKLREKAFDEFKHELADAETKEIDELVSFTHNNGNDKE